MMPRTTAMPWQGSSVPPFVLRFPIQKSPFFSLFSPFLMFYNRKNNLNRTLEYNIPWIFLSGVKGEKNRESAENGVALLIFL
jgi:hypothetical protein